MKTGTWCSGPSASPSCLYHQIGRKVIKEDNAQSAISIELAEKKQSILAVMTTINFQNRKEQASTYITIDRRKYKHGKISVTQTEMNMRCP